MPARRNESDCFPVQHVHRTYAHIVAEHNRKNIIHVYTVSSCSRAEFRIFTAFTFLQCVWCSMFTLLLYGVLFGTSISSFRTNNNSPKDIFGSIFKTSFTMKIEWWRLPAEPFDLFFSVVCWLKYECRSSNEEWGNRKSCTRKPDWPVFRENRAATVYDFYGHANLDDGIFVSLHTQNTDISRNGIYLLLTEKGE